MQLASRTIITSGKDKYSSFFIVSSIINGAKACVNLALSRISFVAQKSTHQSSKRCFKKSCSPPLKKGSRLLVV
jgi:hypothetical protein